MGEQEIKREGYDLGTFNFLRAGWWILHIVAIVGVFYLGYLYGGSVFKKLVLKPVAVNATGFFNYVFPAGIFQLHG